MSDVPGERDVPGATVPTPGRARSLTVRAYVAVALWLLLAGAVLAAAVAILALVATSDAPPLVLLLVPSIAWCAVWLGLPPAVVWSYRRGIHRAATSPDLEEQARAARLQRVRLRFSAMGVTGVDLAGLPPNAGARVVESTTTSVLSIAAVGPVLLFLVLAAILGI